AAEGAHAAADRRDLDPEVGLRLVLEELAEDVALKLVVAVLVHPELHGGDRTRLWLARQRGSAQPLVLVGADLDPHAAVAAAGRAAVEGHLQARDRDGVALAALDLLPRAEVDRARGVRLLDRAADARGARDALARLAAVDAAHVVRLD